MSEMIEKLASANESNEFVPTAGILFPNGRFEPNNGEGHPKHCMVACQDMGIDIPYGHNSDDFLIESGCAMTAGYNGNRFQIKIAKDNPYLDMMLPVLEKYINYGYKVIEGWKFNPEYATALQFALNRVVIEEVIAVNVGGQNAE